MGEYALSFASAASDRKLLLNSGLDKMIYFPSVSEPRGG